MHVMEGVNMKEVWLPIVGFEGLYEVSDQGLVRGLDRLVKTRWGGVMKWKGRILKPSPNPDGYLCLVLTKDGKPYTRKPHQLVAEAFIGPKPEKMQVCHNDGSRTNNHYKNLRYDTFAGNIADKSKHGTQNIGERNGRSKLTKSQILAIKEMLPYTSRREIGIKFGVTRQYIGTIANGKYWKHI